MKYIFIGDRPTVLQKVPIRLSYDDGYFTDTFQVMPKHGYTKFIENILNHENISIKINIASDSTRIKENKLLIFGEENTEDINVYTGLIDAFFEYKRWEVHIDQYDLHLNKTIDI